MSYIYPAIKKDITIKKAATDLDTIEEIKEAKAKIAILTKYISATTLKLYIKAPNLS